MSDLTLDRDIDELPIPTLARNALRRAGINTITELLAQPDDRLLLLRNFGMRSLRDVKRALAWGGLAPAGSTKPQRQHQTAEIAPP